MPDSFRWIYKNKWFGLPVDVYIVGCGSYCLACAEQNTFRSDVIAVGGNRECSRLSGINIDLIQILCYGICGGILHLPLLICLLNKI